MFDNNTDKNVCTILLFDIGTESSVSLSLYIVYISASCVSHKNYFQFDFSQCVYIQTAVIIR